jgi:hypothetical protein
MQSATSQANDMRTFHPLRRRKVLWRWLSLPALDIGELSGDFHSFGIENG